MPTAFQRCSAAFVSCLLGSCLASGPAAAQDAKPFVLRWHGQSFFALDTPGGKKVVFDPHSIVEFERAVVPADVVLCSHLHNDHTQLAAIADGGKGARVFHGLEEVKKGRPADWKTVDEKVGAIRVRTVPLYHDPDEGLTRGKNAAWVVEADGLTFCHLGDVGHELTDAQAKAVGPIDVLMVPVGGIYTINGEQAKQIVKKLKPKLYALPMHYGVPGYDELLGPDEFLDGQPAVKRATDTNELTIPADAKPGENPTVVLLGWKKK